MDLNSRLHMGPRGIRDLDSRQHRMRVEVLDSTSRGSHVKLRVKVPGDNILDQNFRSFVDSSDRNKLYHTPILSFRQTFPLMHIFHRGREFQSNFKYEVLTY